MDAYISKVTSQGQVTLPKEVRCKLNVGRNDYLEFDAVGEAIVLKKVSFAQEDLKRIRAKVKKSGITREKVLRLVEESSEDIWRKRYAQAVPRR